MSDNLVLKHPRAIRADVGEIKLDVRELKHRVTAVEISIANLASTEASRHVGLALRMDRSEDRLDRLRRRSEIT